MQVSREKPKESTESSERRLERARELLAGQVVDIDDLMSLTRDEVAICTWPQPPLNIESCGAAIMCPATGDFWSVWGLPAENDYETFRHLMRPLVWSC